MCQHEFMFKIKKVSKQGCTTKQCPCCKKHAKSNRSAECIDPKCGYQWTKGHKAKKVKKAKKSKKVKSKIGRKKCIHLGTTRHCNEQLFNLSSPLPVQRQTSLDLFDSSAQRQTSIDLFDSSFGLQRQTSLDFLSESPVELQRQTSLHSFDSPLGLQRQTSLDFSDSPVVTQRQTSLDFSDSPLGLQRQTSLGVTDTWAGYMNDNIDEIVPSEDEEENQDWVKSFMNEI